MPIVEIRAAAAAAKMVMVRMEKTPKSELLLHCNVNGALQHDNCRCGNVACNSCKRIALLDCAARLLRKQAASVKAPRL